MTKAAAPSPGSVAQPPRYIPIRDFVEMMDRSKGDNPYDSTFTFAPFIEKMKHSKMSLQEIASFISGDFMDEVEKRLVAFTDPERLDTPEKRQQIVSMLFPSLFYEGQAGFVAKPFSKEFFFMSPAMQELFNSEQWEVKISGKMAEGKMGSPALEAGQLILSTFHGYQPRSNSYSVMTFRDRETLLEKHFKVQIILDYIKTIPRKKVKKMSVAQMHRLLNEWDNEAYWLEQFPPEDYRFEGLVIGYVQDVTESQILSEIKEMMLSEDEDKGHDEDPDQTRKKLNRLFCSYLQMPDIVFGSFFSRNFKYASIFSWSLLGSLEDLAQLRDEDFDDDSTYGQAMHHNEAVIIGDLRKIKSPSSPETKLIAAGYRSLFLHPEYDQAGNPIGVLELASPQPYRFNRQLLSQMGEILSLYNAGTNRWIQNMDNMISFFIQKHFTYIHPSVEWKFINVSQQFLFAPLFHPGKEPALSPVAFKDVYPLYGQADIVGSSKIRNQSIQADMLDNLRRVQAVIRAFRETLDFPLLDLYLAKTESYAQRLDQGGYVSSDESQIVDLLTQEIHPLLRQLGTQYTKLPKKVLHTYFHYLDPDLGIVYRQRRDYENSVHELNEMISSYIDEQVAARQQVLPHFFEKYITDGVEYNIYLGQSILKQGTFTHFFLQDFRLWQLTLMCEVTRLVNKKGPRLTVPLSTAQLIFIYNTPLSIRFNMDEKQFDVDGAYNVRYEILKKRIDKAVIKGSRERLTQSGKIAMVWLQEKDRVEYLEYIAHLQQRGYLTDEVEELELERLQGADGLQALRVTVVD